jgi:hypothetical protein
MRLRALHTAPMELHVRGRRKGARAPAEAES